MFPQAKQVVVAGIQEMDFGAFTGRSADEMADDEAYRAWVDSWCETQCPQGESRAQFDERVCAGMENFLASAAARGEREVYLVAHGGTMMAFLGRYAADERPYFQWNAANCQGYRIGVRISPDGLHVTKVEDFG